MIETHVVNALLLPQYRTEPFYAILTFMNGLVAPSFLFCAGFALSITLQRKWMEYVSLQKSFWRYLVRLGFILIVGYSLHVPSFSLTKIMKVTDVLRWQSFFQSDILHVISLTLCCSVLLAVLLRDRKRFDVVLGVITVIIIFAAPIVRDLDLSGTPMWFRSYFSSKYKSQFPLFPWSAFLFSGVLIGSWIQHAQKTLQSPVIQKRLTIAAEIAILASLLIAILPLSLYPKYNFWNASPEFFFVRLGLVCLLLIGCWLVETRRQGALRTAVTLFGTESLLVYVVHLLMVYGYTFKFSLGRMFGKTLNYPECFLFSIGLIAAMYLLALGWSSLKRWNNRVAKVIQFAVLAGIVLRFIVE